MNTSHQFTQLIIAKQKKLLFQPFKGRPFPNIPPLYIKADGIKPLLYNPKTHKAHSPDGIFGRFLQETSQNITSNRLEKGFY